MLYQNISHVIKTIALMISSFESIILHIVILHNSKQRIKQDNIFLLELKQHQEFDK